MSRIRADQLVNRVGSGGPKFPNGIADGFSVSGVVTATSYRGDGSQLTGIDASSLKDGSNVKVQAVSGGANVTGNVAATGNVTAVDGTFSGNLTVQGTTTTIDTAVTAVDSLAVDGNITALGSVAIGTDSPSASHNLTVRGSNDTTFTNNPSNIFVAGTDTSGSGNSGAGINFGGRYRDDNGNATAFAVVSGIKENTTHNNWAGALTFATRTHGNTGGNQERLRITSTGDVGINCIPHSNAGINLHIHGDNTTSEIRLTNTTTGTGANGSYIQQGGNTLYIGNTESGNTVFEVNGSERLRVTSDGKVRLPDNGKLTVGAGDDLQIWSDDTDQYIRGEKNQLIVRSNNLRLQSYLGENYIHCAMNNAVSLYYDNSKKLETISSGAKITGVLEVTQEYPSIRPTLDLNFAATKTLDRRITFTRDSVGTFTGEDGLVKYASNNTPRFDHNPTTGESLGLLIEEARTNYAVYSSEFDNAAHNKYTATVSANQAVAPDGTTTADLMYPNSSGTSRGIEDVYTLPSTGIYTTSMYVKAAGLSWVQLYAVNGANRAFFNVSTGTKGSQTGGSGSFEDYDIIDAGNGWYRIYVTYDLTTTGSNEYYYLYFADGDNNGSVTANGTDGVYVWGLQVEKGSFPTSYIPTSSTAVTRAQDLAKITGTNFTDFYNQAEGTLVCDQSISDLTTANQYSLILSSNVNESIGMGYRVGGGASGGYGFYIIKSGDALFRNVAGVVSADTPIRTALAYKLNDGATVVNGESAVNDTSLVLPTPDRMLIGEGYSANNELKKGHIRKISYYNKRLTNGQMQGLTQQ